MYGLQVEEVVVCHVYADAEVESGVAAVDDLVVAELDEVGVLGIADYGKEMMIQHQDHWNNLKTNL